MTNDVSPPLTGKVALVTGSASALGQAYIHALVAAGATVAAVDRDAVAGTGVAVTIDADVSNVDGARHAATRAVAELGGVDILVTHADRVRPTALDAPRDEALADFDELFGLHTAGAFLVQRAVVGSMIERGGGEIVNVTTADVLAPGHGHGTNSPKTDIVNASRWAINGFTQAWALGLRDHGIRVNAIAVGADAPDGHARMLLDLLAEGPGGRTGETIGVRSGDPVELPPRRQRGDEMS